MRRKVFASLLLALIATSATAKEPDEDYLKEVTKRVEKRPLSILRIDDIREAAPDFDMRPAISRQDPQALILQQQALLQQQQLQQQLILQLQENQLDLKQKLDAQKQQQQQQQVNTVEDLTELGESVVIKTIDLGQLLAQKYSTPTQPTPSDRPHRHHHHHHSEQKPHRRYHSDDSDEDDEDDDRYHRPPSSPSHYYYQPPPGHSYYGPYPAQPSQYYHPTHYPYYPSYYNPYNSYDYRYPYGGGYSSAPSPYVRSAPTTRKKKLQAPAGVIPLTATILRAGAQQRSVAGSDAQPSVENTENM